MQTSSRRRCARCSPAADPGRSILVSGERAKDVVPDKHNLGMASNLVGGVTWTDRGSRSGERASLPAPGLWAWWRSFEHFSAPGSLPVVVSADRHLVEKEMDQEPTAPRKAHILGRSTGDDWSIWGKRARGDTERLTEGQRRAYDRARAGGSRRNLGPVPPVDELNPETADLDAREFSNDFADLLTSVYIGPELRSWQRDALEKWSRAGECGIVEAVTGTGKTAVGIAAIAEAAAVGRRAVVLVPTIGLQRQWVRALSQGLDGVRVGSVGGGSRDSWRTSDVIVSTVNSAVDRPWLADQDPLLVADEVHRYGALTFATALAPTYRTRLGLTATLQRSDDGVEEILLPYFGRTIEGCSYRRAYDDGILAPVRVALVGVDFTPTEQAEFDQYEEDFSRAWRALVTKWGVDDSTFGNLMADASRLAAGDGDPSSIGTARWFLKSFANRRELLAGCRNKASFVESIAKVVPYAQRTLVFSDQIDTAQAAADVLVARGLRAIALTSETSPADRESVMEQFREGEHDALCAPRILDEGIDVPAVDFAAVLAASKTRRQMIQRVGRIIRPKPDGRDAVFAIAYVKGTGEDPARGGHVAFLEEFLEVAQEVRTVDVDSAAPLLASWLGAGGQEPERQQTGPGPGPEASRLVTPGPETLRPSAPRPAARPAVAQAPPPEREAEAVATHSVPTGSAVLVSDGGTGERDLRHLVLTVFDDFDHVATGDQVVRMVAETHGTSIDTAKWEVASADIGDAVTWVSIAGVMTGCGGSSRSTAPIRAQMLQALEDCVLAFRESGGLLSVTMLKAKIEETLLANCPLERLADLVEEISTAARRQQALPECATDPSLESRPVPTDPEPERADVGQELARPIAGEPSPLRMPTRRPDDSPRTPTQTSTPTPTPTPEPAPPPPKSAANRPVASTHVPDAALSKADQPRPVAATEEPLKLVPAETVDVDAVVTPADTPQPYRKSIPARLSRHNARLEERRRQRDK